MNDNIHFGLPYGVGKKRLLKYAKMADCTHELVPEINYSGKGGDVECRKCGALWISMHRVNLTN